MSITKILCDGIYMFLAFCIIVTMYTVFLFIYIQKTIKNVTQKIVQKKRKTPKTS